MARNALKSRFVIVWVTVIFQFALHGNRAPEHGAKYDMGYAPASHGTADSNAARVAHLKELVNASKGGLKLDYPEVPGLETLRLRASIHWTISSV